MGEQTNQESGWESFGRDVIEIRYYEGTQLTVLDKDWHPTPAHRPSMRLVRLNSVGDCVCEGYDIGLYGVCVPGMPYSEVEGCANAMAVAEKMLEEKRAKDHLAYSIAFSTAALESHKADMAAGTDWKPFMGEPVPLKKRVDVPLMYGDKTILPVDAPESSMSTWPEPNPVHDEPNPPVPTKHWKSVIKKPSTSSLTNGVFFQLSAPEYISVYYNGAGKVLATVEEDESSLWKARIYEACCTDRYIDHESAKRAVEVACA